MLKRLLTYGHIAIAGLWVTAAVNVGPVRAARPVPRLAEPALLGAGLQWQRATAVIEAALDGFERVKSLQAAAMRQIDATDYALARLIHDLRPAMALPTDVTGLRAVLAEAERTSRGRETAVALAA